jgi:hypothetical protein
MSGISQNDLNETIRTHYNATITEGEGLSEDTPLNIQFAHINTDKLIDIIAVPEHESTCGSGGCVASIFVQNENKEFENIPFGYAVKEISVSVNITNGMRDLIINEGSENRMIWDSARYLLNNNF